MQGERECQDKRGIFKKFWLRGGGEGYFADDERGWGATPSPCIAYVLCCVVLCLCALSLSITRARQKNTLKYFTYSKNSASATPKNLLKKNIKFCDIDHKNNSKIVDKCLKT